MSPDGDGRLLLIRHTESAWNALDVFTGWIDVPLSEEGRRHALEVGKSLRGRYRIDRAFTSSLLRAQETLEIVLEGANALPGAEVSRDWRLNERFYGTWQGKSRSQVVAKHGEDAVKAVRRTFDARPPGGESLADVAERVLAYFEECILPELVQGKTVLIAAHISPLRVIAGHVQEKAHPEIPNFEIANGAVLVFRHHHELGAFSREE
jgi:phosphoglycerate mutase, BPG-dependent, family 1